MLMGCYLRQGKVYAPVKAQTEAGYYLDIEPVEVAAVTDTANLRQALLVAYARGNPTVPTPTRANFPTPVVLRHAGVKTWRAFVRGARSWSIEETERSFCILGKQEHSTDGWVRDPSQTINFPPGTVLDTVIDRLVEILQAASKGTDKRPDA